MMNRFFTLLLAASCLTAVGQTSRISDLLEQAPEDEFGLVLSVLSQPEAADFLALVSDESLSLTLFLPTNEAIESWEAQGEGVWEDEGLDHLMSHLIAGEFYSADFIHGQFLESFNNVAMLVEITAGGVYFNGGSMAVADIANDNGVVHIMGSFNTPPSPEPITVTFQVDMTYQSVSAEGVYLAGTFQGWDPTTTPLSFVGDGIWEVSFMLEVGTYEFAFINGNNWSGVEAFSEGDCLALSSCGDVLGHRQSIFTTETVYSTCFGGCGSCESLFGCTNPKACNFDPAALFADNSCNFCLCGEGTVWDDDSQTCIVANPSDSNFDGCVQLNDLLDLLSAYGNCGAEESAWQCGDPLEYQGYDYETVQIGEQCWFAENVRAQYYRNGDLIPASMSDGDWESATFGAASIYGEDEGCNDYSPTVNACDSSEALVQYGRLYNWYAAFDSRQLCPSGWKVPSESEFNILEEVLGGSATAGQQMKSNAGWSNNGNGQNEVGFDARAAGYRHPDGSFRDAGVSANFWTSSEASASKGWDRYIYAHETDLFRNDYNSRGGFSIRCLKDTE